MADVERVNNESASQAPRVPSNPIPPAADQSGSALNDIQVRLFRFLYENQSPAVTTAFEKVERNTNVKREHWTYLVFGIAGIYLVIGQFAELLCNLIAFAYPCYASHHALRTAQKEDDTMWLTYWTVFAFFSLIDFWAGHLYSYFPLWWLTKTLFFVYLSLPQTRGAEKLYKRVVDPIFTKIDAWEARRKQA